ncbi:hypothetical protein ACWEPC_09115 [Nonomuraea sp. NPDC004297]
MGKYDGMDPKLVRDLVTEVRHAATEMRGVEDRVRAVMHRAGLPAQATHRPAQIADAVDDMVKDVNVRLGELEKRVESPSKGTTPTDEPKEVRGRQDKYDNPRADAKPDTDAKPDADGKTGSDSKPDADGKTGSDSKPDADGKTGSDSKPDADGKTGSDEKPDADGKTGSEGKPDAGGKTESDGKTCDDAEDTGTGKDGSTGSEGKTGDQVGDQSKGDDLDSRRDRGTEADDRATDTPAKETNVPVNEGDTPATGGQAAGKPQVVVVDGVKVLQVPLEPPVAAVIEDMLEHPDKVRPADMPQVSADGATNVTNVNDWADDGSDVVSVEASPPGLDALQTVIEDHREIAPQDMPGVQVPAGEYGKGEWAEREIRPDGPVGSIDAGGPSAGVGASVTLPPTDTTTVGGSMPESIADGGPRVDSPLSTPYGTETAQATDTTYDADPARDTDTRDASTTHDTNTARDADTVRDAGTARDADTPPGDGACDSGKDADTPPSDDDTGKGTDTGKDSDTDRGADTPPTSGDTKPDLPTPDKPDQGAGDKPDQGTGDKPDQGAGGQGKPVAIPPTNPADTNADTSPGTSTNGTHTNNGAYSNTSTEHTPGTPQEPGSGTDAPAAGRDAVTPRADAYGQPVRGTDPAFNLLIAYDVDPGQDPAAGSGVVTWANDGTDVVSADATPPTPDALATVIDHHRDIRPQDMPGVEIPAGGYGKGEWAPQDVGPDGPPGAVDPGRPERSV